MFGPGLRILIVVPHVMIIVGTAFVLAHPLAHLHTVQPAFRETVSLFSLVVAFLVHILLFAFLSTTLVIRGADELSMRVVDVTPGCKNARRMQVFEGGEVAHVLGESLPGNALQVLHPPSAAGNDEEVEVPHV